MDEKEIIKLENEVLLKEETIKRLIDISKIEFSSVDSDYRFLQQILIIIERIETFLSQFDEGRYHLVDKKVILSKALSIYNNCILYIFSYILNKYIKKIDTCNRRIISSASPMSKKRYLNDLKEEEIDFAKVLQDLSFLIVVPSEYISSNRLTYAIDNDSLTSEALNKVYAYYYEQAKTIMEKHSLFATGEVIIRTGIIGDVTEKTLNESQRIITFLLNSFSRYSKIIEKKTINKIDVLIKYLEFLKKVTNNPKPKQ